MLTLLSSLLLSIAAPANGLEPGAKKDISPAAKQTKTEETGASGAASDAQLKEADDAASAAKAEAEAAAAAVTKAEDGEKAARLDAAQAQGGLTQARAAALAAHGVERKAHEDERAARAAAKVAAKAEATAAEAKLKAAEAAAVVAGDAAAQADAAVTKAEDAARAAELRVTTAAGATEQARAYAKAMEKYLLAAVAYAKQLHAQEEESEKSCGDEPTSREKRRCERRIRNARVEKAIESETRSFRGAMLGARAGRCGTAVCWGPGYKWALEPLVELPVGKAFSMPGSSLARYLNSNELQVSFNAGLRLWLWWDWLSVSTFMSKVLVTGNDTIYTDTSGVPLPVSQIRRPFPGIGVGLFGDMLWLSLDYDQLRNGNSMATKSPDFRPNTIVSHAFTITIAVASIAGLRNGIGTLVEQQRRKKAEAEAKKAEVSDLEVASSKSAAPLASGKPVAPVAPKGPGDLGTPAAGAVDGEVASLAVPVAPPMTDAGPVIRVLSLRPRGG